MRTLLVALNAKYIHTSLALRWLYVANRGQTDISFVEFTIKESIDNVVEQILSLDPDVVGLSVYIWNVEQMREVAAAIRVRAPKIVIILGGPEVSYDASFFLRTWSVDFVVSGEGEFVLGELIHAIQHKRPANIEGVSSAEYLSKSVVRADLDRLSALPSPYLLERDSADRAHKLLYFESSRGCPYRCQYCLSSLEKGVRYFPMEYVLKTLEQIIGSNVKQIKFLDRTFNLDMKHTHAIFNSLITHHRPDLTCQFEIYADLLSDQTIEWLNRDLPQGYFRFEIGVQSTHEPTNVAVSRRQDFPRLAQNVRKIMAGGKIDLHLDLIAGLPYENFERFVRSFNDVFALGAKEVQLGFLKMLRGTGLRNNAAKYGYEYDPKAPYEIVSNADISSTELERIADAEHALEKFWNSGRFSRTMNATLYEPSPYEGRYFEFFDDLGVFYRHNQLPHHGYQLEDLFGYLNGFLSSKGIDASSLLREDYYSNFTTRPKGFWQESIDKRRRKQLLYQIGQDKNFLATNRLTRKIVEKQTSLYPLSGSELLLTIFLDDGERLSIRYPIDKV